MSNLRDTAARVAAEIRSGPPAYINDFYGWAAELDAAAKADAEKSDEYEQTLVAMTAWLEAHQPDVFRRGLWEAMETVKTKVTP
jgi:hypothetical protein